MRPRNPGLYVLASAFYGLAMVVLIALAESAR